MVKKSPCRQAESRYSLAIAEVGSSLSIYNMGLYAASTSN